MTYTLYTQSFGITNTNAKVTISEVGTGAPAVILATATGGIISDRGLTQTDSSGNISVYIDTAKTWKFTLADETFTPTFQGSFTASDYSKFQTLVAGTNNTTQSIVPSLVRRVSSTAIEILTRPMFGGPVLHRMSYNNYNSVDSAGVKCEWWRQIGLIELLQAYLYSTTAPSGTSGVWSTSTLEVRPGVPLGGQSLSNLYLTSAVGAYKEWAVTVPSSGRVGFLFGVSGTAPESVTITCGGGTTSVDIRRTLAYAGKIELVVGYVTGCTPGAATLRVAHAGTAGKNLYLIGPLLADIRLGMPHTIPSSEVGMAYSFDGGMAAINHPGSIDVAIYDSVANQWCGSYHGGMGGPSTFTSMGQTIDVSTTGSVVLARDLAIEQSGDITNKLAYTTRHRLMSAAEMAVDVAISGSIQATAAYCGMTTAPISWVKVNGSDYAADGAKVEIAPSSTYTQVSPAAPGRKLVLQILAHELNGVRGVPSHAHVQVTSSGPYAKVRAGVVDYGIDAPLAITDWRFTISHAIQVDKFA